MPYIVGDRLYAYCVNCKKVTSHYVVDHFGTAVCTEC